MGCCLAPLPFSVSLHEKRVNCEACSTESELFPLRTLHPNGTAPCAAVQPTKAERVLPTYPPQLERP